MKECKRIVANAEFDIDDNDCDSDAGNDQNYCNNLFDVHMGVVTANLGKRLVVVQNCLLETMLLSKLGTDAVKIIDRNMDENNTIKLKVLDWAKVVNLADCLETRLLHTEIANVGEAGRHPKWMQSFNDDTESNSITVTIKGSVIFCFSWIPATAWNDDKQRRVLFACEKLCTVMRACC